MIHDEERFEGERVAIRLLSERDAEALLAFRRSNRTFLQPFEKQHADEQFSEEYIRAIIGRWNSERIADSSYSFGIFAQGQSYSEQDLAGTIRLSVIVRGAFQSSMLGYAMAERYNNRGYMSEAVSLVLGVAFTRLQLHRVQANAMPRNIASLRVLEKNGFRREGYSPHYLSINGVWEDHVTCAITAEDYRDTRYGKPNTQTEKL